MGYCKPKSSPMKCNYDYVHSSFKAPYISIFSNYMYYIPAHAITTRHMYEDNSIANGQGRWLMIDATYYNEDQRYYNAGHLKNTAYMFYNCTYLNSDFAHCKTFVEDASYMYAYCPKLNQSISSTYPNLKNAAYMFFNDYGNISFNVSSCPNLINASHMFDGISGFSYMQPYISGNVFPNNLRDASYMFRGTKFNSTYNNFSLPDSLTNASHMFENCIFLNRANYEGGVYEFINKLSNNLTNTSYMFANCRNFNYEFIGYGFTNNIVDASYMFAYCVKSDIMPFGRIKLPTKLVNASHMFDSTRIQAAAIANIFNNFHDNITDFSYMFNNCIGAGSSTEIVIGVKARNLAYMFANCRDLALNIRVYSDSNLENVSNMLYNHTNNKRIVRIFCKNISKFTGREEKFMVCSPISWTTVTNGYYNNKYGIYIYKNL